MRWRGVGIGRLREEVVRRGHLGRGLCVFVGCVGYGNGEHVFFLADRSVGIMGIMEYWRFCRKSVWDIREPDSRVWVDFTHLAR